VSAAAGATVVAVVAISIVVAVGVKVVDMDWDVGVVPALFRSPMISAWWCWVLALSCHVEGRPRDDSGESDY
jgi:hypothetical protein